MVATSGSIAGVLCQRQPVGSSWSSPDSLIVKGSPVVGSSTLTLAAITFNIRVKH